MKRIYITILILVILIITAWVIFNKFNKEKVEDNPIVITNIEEDDIIAGSYETRVLKDGDAYVKFDVKYPSFKKVDSDFNLSIEKLLKDKMENDKLISKENWQARYDTQMEGENLPKAPSKDEDKFSFYSDFVIVQSNSSYISFVLKYGGFTGGAHGYEDNVSFNYDIKNKRMIELKDLFPDNRQYLKYLSEESRNNLIEKYTVSDLNDIDFFSEESKNDYIDSLVEAIENGTESKAENFSVFTFTKDKIKIYFAQYQVGPYVMGMPEVEIKRK